MADFHHLRKAWAILWRIGLPSVAGVSCVVGCGTTSASLGQGRPPVASADPTVNPSASAVAACAASDLRIRLDTKAAGAAAGTSFVPLDFTNTSAASCALSGFPVVSFAASRAGGAVGQPGTADRTAAAMRLSLAPGGSAHVWLRLASAANFPPTQCGPVSAAGFRVTLPGWHTGAFVVGRALTCARVVRGSQPLVIEPFSPGLARRGAA